MKSWWKTTISNPVDISDIWNSSSKEIKMAASMYSLSALDYVIIVGMFSVSAFIGVFFACFGGRQKTSEEYFLGNRRMGVIPVIISMTVTVMSAITYLGVPGEVYMLGPKFGLMFVSKFVVAFLTTTFFLPVFYRLRIVSVYEYYDRRFSVAVRYSILVAEFAHSMLYCGVVIYIPSLALSTITGVNLSLCVIAVGAVCTFYTTIGGFKAVIWADVFQAAVMTVGFLLIIVVGTVRIGGAAEGWRRAKEGQRTQLVDFSLDPTVRYTFWTIMVGGSFMYLMINGSKQAVIQRFNSCKTETQAKVVAWFGIVGMGVVEMLAVICGMVVYAWYAHCDPLTSGRIVSRDQLIPLVVMDLFHDIPGLPGIAIAGAFCASLSSISSLINSLAAITGETLVKSRWKNMSESFYAKVVKVISAAYGVIGICVGLLSSSLGTVIQIVLSLGGIFGGPGLGVMCLGIFVPRADSRSALCGLIVAVAVGLTLEVGARMTGSRAQPNLPLSVEDCEAMNITSDFATSIIMSTTEDESYYSTNTPAYPLPNEESTRIGFFAISNLHYSTISTLVTVLVGILVSYLPGSKSESDPAFFSPFIQKYYFNKKGTTFKTVDLDKEEIGEGEPHEMDDFLKKM